MPSNFFSAVTNYHITDGNAQLRVYSRQSEKQYLPAPWIYTPISLFSRTEFMKIKCLCCNISAFTNSHITGGNRQLGLYSQATCEAACSATPGCSAVDYDVTDQSCWFHGANSVCRPLAPMVGTTHIKYINCCKYIINIIAYEKYVGPPSIFSIWRL